MPDANFDPDAPLSPADRLALLTTLLRDEARTLILARASSLTHAVTVHRSGTRRPLTATELALLSALSSGPSTLSMLARAVSLETGAIADPLRFFLRASPPLALFFSDWRLYTITPAGHAALLTPPVASATFSPASALSSSTPGARP